MIYSALVRGYGAAVRVAALRNGKAQKWLAGRKGLLANIRLAMETNQAPVAWFHCASLGEFEQARPVIESFKQHFPAYKIFLTFFSPSGYEVRKNYPVADYVFYLPLDTPANARQFVQSVKPRIALFAKYEFWRGYLRELQRNKIPAISFSAIFRPNQLFFKSYGGFYRNLLRTFSHIFVQNQESEALLHRIGITSVTVAGDTRFDRVVAVCEQKKEIPLAAAFKNGSKLLVIGSSWAQDADVYIPFLNQFSESLKVIIAPHEIHEADIQTLQAQLHKKSIRFSQAQENTVDTFDVLIIDNMGMLSSLYQYGEFAYVGGALGKGLHNILEAATFGMPVFFGSNYRKFREAVDLVALSAAFSVQNTAELTTLFTELYRQDSVRQQKSDTASQYVRQHTGATGHIIDYCRKLLAEKHS